MKKASGEPLQRKVARTPQSRGRSDLHSPNRHKRLMFAKLLKKQRIDLRDSRARGIWTPSMGSGIAQRDARGVKREESERLSQPHQIKSLWGKSLILIIHNFQFIVPPENDNDQRGDDPTLCCAVRFRLSTLYSGGAVCKVKEKQTNKNAEGSPGLTANSILSPLLAAAKGSVRRKG